MDEKTITKHFLNYKKNFTKILGKKATTDRQLTDLGTKLFGKKYIGTFSVDYKPKKNPKKQYFILNNKPSNHPGEHWIACYKNGDIYYYYDSFSRKAKRLIPQFARGKKIKHTDLTDKEQGIKEEICGVLCMSFLQCVDAHGIRASIKI